MDRVIAGLAREYPEVTNLPNFGVALFRLRDDPRGCGPCCWSGRRGRAGPADGPRQRRRPDARAQRSAAARAAVRTALRASRFRLVRQMLTEAWLLSGAGAAAGLLVALWCQRIVVDFAPRALPRVTEMAFNGPVLACAAGLGIAAGLLFGVVPAVQLSGQNRGSDPLKTGTRGTEARSAIRRGLVVAQVALAVVLLVGAGLLIKSFARLMAVPSGFVGDRVLTLRISLPDARYPGRPDVTAYFERLLAAAASLPGVQSAGAGAGCRWPCPPATGADVEGRPLVTKALGAADWCAVTPGFIETLGIRMVRPRRHRRRHGRIHPVPVINETTARTLFPAEDPIGKRCAFPLARVRAALAHDRRDRRRHPAARARNAAAARGLFSARAVPALRCQFAGARDEPRRQDCRGPRNAHRRDSRRGPPARPGGARRADPRDGLGDADLDPRSTAERLLSGVWRSRAACRPRSYGVAFHGRARARWAVALGATRRDVLRWSSARDATGLSRPAAAGRRPTSAGQSRPSVPSHAARLSVFVVVPAVLSRPPRSRVICQCAAGVSIGHRPARRTMNSHETAAVRRGVHFPTAANRSQSRPLALGQTSNQNGPCGLTPAAPCASAMTSRTEHHEQRDDQCGIPAMSDIRIAATPDRVTLSPCRR